MLLNNIHPLVGDNHIPHRFRKDVNNPPFWQVTIVDTCNFGREGLRIAIHQHFLSSGYVEVTVATTLALPRLAIMMGEKNSSTGQRCLVLRLPVSSSEALHLLLELGMLPVGYYARVVVMSDFSSTILLRVLISTGMTGQICLIGDHLPISRLCRTIVPVEWESKAVMGGQNEVLVHQPHRQFTPAERRVLIQRLQGVPVREQARQADTRIKTIYTQRANGLDKLLVRDIQTLLRQFCSVKNFIPAGNLG
ncbi:hypothetical protein AB4O99_25000 [Klebsiella pasteurii]|uniref:hypothetical protein n=1 Tax=Klebsiella pasteurii TaxID=2587529 RepID=UPI00287C2AF4|nr:hypothetical protein [Klebsiella pasteurii]MDS7872717.1 hypothetical protein [Klebsiella pasteurii]